MATGWVHLSSLFPMRSVVLGAFLPAVLFGIGIGIVLPLIPLSTVRFGGGVSLAGISVAVLPLGKIVADIPSGQLIARIGDRLGMVVAAIVASVALASIFLIGSLWVLFVGVFILGNSTGIFHLARHSYLTAVTPEQYRARVLSTLGGTHRLGYFVGPVVGAGMINRWSLGSAYLAAAVFTGLTLLVLLLVREKAKSKSSDVDSAAKPVSVVVVIRRYRGVFIRMGSVAALVGLIRGARQAVIPLWGAHLGLDADIISLLFGISGALDMVLFYPAGIIMDRLGRLWNAIPSMAMMTIGLAVLPMTDSMSGLAVVACLLGIANGLGAGIVMTLGSDIAPSDMRAGFLGVWRLFQDCGEACGPVVVSVGTAVVSLSVGVWVSALFGGASPFGLARWTPRYSAFANLVRRRRSVGEK